MPGFAALPGYSAPVLVAFGALSFLGFLGCGLGLVRMLALATPGPWREVQAALVGLLAFASVVAAAGMLGLAAPTVLASLWLLSVALGLPLCWRHVRGADLRPRLGGAAGPLIALGALAAGVNLLLAAAPSTKSDEVYYHMLLPARIVLDGQLQFYPQPWPGAVLPQMGFQIAAAPLHALGSPDAPNVLSWCLGLLLSWLAYRLVLSATGDRAWSLLAAVSAQVGLLPSVTYTTGGAHALGDLASAAALLALLSADSIVVKAGRASYVGLVATLGVAAVSAKISLLPLAGLATLLAALAGGRRLDSWRPLAAALLPWLVFFLPLALWTWARSGSPFGPLLAGWFGGSLYGEGIAAEILASREANRFGLSTVVLRYLGSTAPPIWLGAALFFVLPGGRPRGRWIAGGLLGLQLFFVWRLLPQDLRFLAGLPFALFVIALGDLYVSLRTERRRRRALLAAALLLVPWLGVQLYRAAGLVPVSLGLEDPQKFARRQVPLYEDFLALDAALPEEAVLFARFRTASIYSPRPIYYHPADLPPLRRAFALHLRVDPLPEGEESEQTTCEDYEMPSDCDLGPVLYSNPQARYRTYRTPGRQPLVGVLEVREVLHPGTAAGP